MNENFRFLIYITFVSIVFVGCNQDESCAPAYAISPNVPEDSLCFGEWQWSYSLEHVWEPSGGLWQVVDTVFPGETIQQFETMDYVYGTIGKTEICFNVNGSVASGCYKKWASNLYTTDTSSYVFAGFLEWSALGYGGLGVEAHYPTGSGNHILAKIGIHMFETEGFQADTLFYSNWFIKVD